MNVTDPVLAALVVLILCLFGVAALGRRLRGRMGHACTVLCLAGATFAGTASILDAPVASLTLPFGLPGQATHFTLDPIGAGTLLLLFLAGALIAAFAAEAASRGTHPPASTPVILGGLATATLAGDATLMAAGLSIAAIGAWSGMPPGRNRSVVLGAMLGATGGLFVAGSLLAASGGDAAPDADPATRYDVALGCLCALTAAGALAGLAPLDGWLGRSSRTATPAVTGALLCGALAPAALSLLLRLTLGDADFAPPMWWAWGMLVLGAATTLQAGWRATSGAELGDVAVAASRRVVGLAVTDLALVALGRAMDLPELAATALAGMMLWVAVLAVFGPLAILAAAVLQQGTGSRRLDRSGGLLHFMPATSLALLAALTGMAALPATLGFAAVYLTFQAVLSAPRTPDLVSSLLIAGTVAVQGLAMALGVASAVRTFGIACLGRPRTPRAAAAVEAPRPVRVVLLGAAAVGMLFGLLPGLLLRAFGAPVIDELTGLGLGGRAGLLYLGGGIGAADYAPLPLAALLGMCGGMVLWLRRRDATAGVEAVPVWQDGFPATAPWMPFGDPLTQSDGTGFVPPGVPAIRLSALLAMSRSGPALARLRHLRVARIHAPLALLVVFAAVLVVVGAGGG